MNDITSFADLVGLFGTGNESAPIANMSYGPMSLVSTASETTSEAKSNLNKVFNPSDAYDPNAAYNPNAAVVTAQAKGTTKPSNSGGSAGGTGGQSGSKTGSSTASEIYMYEKSAKYLVDSVSDFSNAALSWRAGKMKAGQYEFVAKQNERAAELLYKNIADINRSARLDANVYKLQNANVKAKQKEGQAATGFAVGKGSYKATLDTTDARTNYNIAMNMLKADLQVAETVRKAGEYKAQAEIARGNAQISRRKARADMWSGVIGGVGNLANAAVSFYSGKWGIKKA